MTSWPRVLSPRPMARYGYRSPKEPHVVMTIRRPGYVTLGPVVITVIPTSATGKRPNGQTSYATTFRSKKGTLHATPNPLACEFAFPSFPFFLLFFIRVH